MNYISSYNFYVILPELYLFFSSCIILIYGVIFSTSHTWGYPSINFNISLLTLQIFIFGFILVYFCPLFIMFDWNYLLVFDFYTYKLKIVILFSVIGWMFLCFFYIKKEFINSFEYWVLILLSIIAMFLILETYDLLSMFLAIEFQSLIFYIIVSFKRTSEFSTEAGLKYFILGAFSSILLLFGSSLFYTLTGLTNFGDITKFITGFAFDNFFYTFNLSVSLIFLVISLLFKLGAAPFHMWSPDVYEGSPTSTSSFLIIMPKIAIITLIIRLFFVSFQDYFFVWEKIILYSSLTSLVIGSFGAFIQKKWKRFIAYSSINHIGFITLALSTGDNFGRFSVIFYTFIYIITMFIIFSIIMSYRIYKYPLNYQTRFLNNIYGLSKMNPMLALTTTLILFSIAGIPPLTGFFAKIFVLLTALQNNIYGLSIVAIILSCLSCFYYIRLIRIMYFSSVKNWLITYPLNKSISLLLAISLCIICLLFLDLELITLFFQQIF